MSTSDYSDHSADLIDCEDATSNYSGEEFTDDDDPVKVPKIDLPMMSPSIESSVSYSSNQVVIKGPKGRLIKSISEKNLFGYFEYNTSS